MGCQKSVVSSCKNERSGLDMNGLFSYSKDCRLIRRIPIGIRMALYFASCLAVVLSGIEFSIAACLAVLVVYSIFSVGLFSLFEDAKQAFAYISFVIVSNLLSFLFKGNLLADIRISDFDFLLILRIIALIFLASLFFRTTSFYDIWKTADNFSFLSRKKKEGGISDLSKTFIMFVSFIPMVFRTWREIEKSYAARGGKGGLAKIAALFPVLIRNCVLHADRTYDAFKAREP